MALINLRGKVVAVLPIQRGTAKSGKEWAKQEFVLELENSNSMYPNRIVAALFGQEKIDQSNVRVNDVLTVGVGFSAREYNGRYYNDVSAVSISHEGYQPPTTPPQGYQPQQPQQPPMGSPRDDIPF